MLAFRSFGATAEAGCTSAILISNRTRAHLIKTDPSRAILLSEAWAALVTWAPARARSIERTNLRPAAALRFDTCPPVDSQSELAFASEHCPRSD